MEFNLLSQLVSKAGNKPVPLWGQFEILPLCNLSCSMCYVHNPSDIGQSIKNLQPVSFWIETARQAVEAGMLVLSITGGETLLYPEIDILLSELSRMGIIITFNSNGTLIDENRAARLSEYSLAKINLTLYGASNDTYRKMTGCPDGFDRISRAIDYLQEKGQNVYLNGVLTPDNHGDLEKMINYASSKGLVLHETSYLFPRREKCEEYREDNRLSPEEAAKVSNYYLRIINGEKKYKHFAAASAYREHAIAALPEQPTRNRRCRAGIYSFAVDWRGNLQPCVLFSAIQEDLKRESFADAWKKCVSRMHTVSLPKKCTRCSHLESCFVCPAAVFLETGTSELPPEYLCKYSEEVLKMWERDSEGISVKVMASDGILTKGDFRLCEG